MKGEMFMFPKPYIFKSESELIKKLQGVRLQKKAEQFYKQRKDMDWIIKHMVASNTYRAFKKSSDGKSPSTVFRSWTKQYLNGKLQKIKKITNQNDYDRLIHSATVALCKHWKQEMGYELGYGRGAKLLNLVFKALPTHHEISARKTLQKLLHVPLDSFSIRGLKKIVREFKIPANASMGFIKDKKAYNKFQEKIRIIVKEAKVPPIYYDILVWGLSHVANKN